MKIDFEGQVRVLDLQHVSLRHAVAVQEYTGLAVFAWQEGLSGTGDVSAAGYKADPAGTLRKMPMFTDPAWIKGIAAAHWLMLAQNGECPPLDDDYDCDVLGFAVAFLTARFAEVKAARAPAAPDPTVPPGRPARSSRRTAPKKPPASQQDARDLPPTGS